MTTMKNLSDYKTWIFDLDGTLYHQKPVRIEMALRLLFHYLIRPFKFRELLMLRDYRLLREQRFKAEETDFQKSQIAEIAQRYNTNTAAVEKIVDFWLIQKPLKILKRWCRDKVLSAIKTQQAKGTTIIVYSDYPVAEKLQALELQPNYSFWSSDNLIRCMKPDSKGLKNILKHLKLNPAEVLYVGDRDDRDGLCASGAGVDYLDINNFEKNFLG